MNGTGTGWGTGTTEWQAIETGEPSFILHTVSTLMMLMMLISLSHRICVCFENGAPDRIRQQRPFQCQVLLNRLTILGPSKWPDLSDRQPKLKLTMIPNETQGPFKTFEQPTVSSYWIWNHIKFGDFHRPFQWHVDDYSWILQSTPPFPPENLDLPQNFRKQKATLNRKHWDG